nr:putative amino acid permease 7 [Quercus suber]
MKVTLKSPPTENQTMKKASTIAIIVTTLFYLSCGGFGYAAFGDDSPGNLLMGFKFFEPYWLIDFANSCVVLHLVGGYQIFSQPLFANVERWFAKKVPSSGFVNNNHPLKLALLLVIRLNLLRLWFRSVYVVSTTGIAMMFPYFNQHHVLACDITRLDQFDWRTYKCKTELESALESFCNGKDDARLKIAIDSRRNRLTEFGLDNALIDYANVCIALYLVGGYQGEASLDYSFLSKLAKAVWFGSNIMICTDCIIPSSIQYWLCKWLNIGDSII